MKIKSPLITVAEVVPLASAGADCFYAGVSDEVVFSPRSVSEGGVSSVLPDAFSNFTSLDAFREAVHETHKCEKELFVVFNASYYTNSQIDDIFRFLHAVGEVDGVIVSGIDFVSALRAEFPRLQLSASTISHVMNSRAVSFYKDYGVSSFVLPQPFRFDEISTCVARNSDVEFECFVLGADCPMIQGICSYGHEGRHHFDNDRRPECHKWRVINVAAENAEAGLGYRIALEYSRYIPTKCGACFVQDLMESGVQRLKIAGRGYPSSEKLANVRLVKFAVDNSHLPYDDYRAAIRDRFRDLFDKDCDQRCLYGELA